LNKKKIAPNEKIEIYQKRIEQVDTQITDSFDKIKQDKDYLARSYLTDMYLTMIKKRIERLKEDEMYPD
jgi:hypothetical protein